MLNSDEKLGFLGINLHSRVRRRWMVVLTYFVYFVVMSLLAMETNSTVSLQSYHIGFWLMLVVTSLLGGFSVFREGGPVKKFADFAYRLRGM